MKNKIILAALASTMLLGGCHAYNHQQSEATSVTTYKQQTVYGVGGEQLSRSDVRKVQASLKREGYYKGAIDGIWGNQTSSAILAYQLTHDQSQTGTLSADTLQEFGVQVDRDSYNARH